MLTRILLALFVLLAVGSFAAEPMEIPVVVVKYFPVNGELIDKAVTGDWGAPLNETREKVGRVTQDVLTALQEGSRYHGYKIADAKPSLKYTVLKTYEFLEALPLRPKKANERVPLTDYAAIMQKIGIKEWVEEKGVKEVWVWGYHGGVINLWESNMSGPFGDISNSNRDPNDLPVFKKTYTVYHYNYQRGPSECVENHIHQIEAVLNYVDGRDRTPAEKWPELLFWGKFVGSDRSHKIVRPGCGWAHYPPNGERDYDWANPRFVETDIEDWKPDGSGQKQKLNAERWGKNSLKWFVYWMQNLPGAESGLQMSGKALRNWWGFVGDFDRAMTGKWRLSEE
ncbi:MAG TPA: hypothetical protein VGP72_11675 [Planctomycetota bacterium]|jgi:hypothetical protein